MDKLIKDFKEIAGEYLAWSVPIYPYYEIQANYPKLAQTSILFVAVLGVRLLWSCFAW